MMQLLSQLSSGENLLQTSNISTNYFDLEAQKRIAENIRLVIKTFFYDSNFNKFYLKVYKMFNKIWKAL